MAESGGERLSERIAINGAAAAAESALEVDGTLRWRSGGGEQCLRLESEVLGLDVQGTRITVRALAEAPRSGSICAFWGESGERRRARRDYSLEMPTEEAALLWSSRLKNYIDSLGRPKTLFVILNPFAGNKSARTIFQNEIKPILEAGNINYTVVETKYRNHAQEMTISLDLPKYDGIVCVSGDGVLVEVGSLIDLCITGHNNVLVILSGEILNVRNLYTTEAISSFFFHVIGALDFFLYSLIRSI